jgi:hypothetical protein
MERLRAAHARWNHTRNLVVQVARGLSEDFESEPMRAELKAVLKAEHRARLEFERLAKAEGNGNDSDGDGNH